MLWWIITCFKNPQNIIQQKKGSYSLIWVNNCLLCMKFDHYLNRSNNFFSTLHNSFQYLAPYLDRIHRTLPIFSWSMTDILYIRQFFTYGNFINQGKSKMRIICGVWISPNVSFRAVCSSSGNTFEWNGDSNSSSLVLITIL